MELHQLRYVVAIAEEGSFTKAAQTCHVVQSALSHQVKALEKELGFALFARNSRHVELTAAGRAFIGPARESLAQAQRAVADGAAATGELRSDLRIGVIPTLSSIDVAALAARFVAGNPKAGLVVTGGGSDRLVDLLLHDHLDVAFVGLPDHKTPPGIGLHRLGENRHVAAVPAAHILSTRSQLHLAELADEQFIDFPPGTPGRQQSDLAFSAAGLRRSVPYVVSVVEVMLDLVSRGVGIALLPPATVERRADVTAVALIDGPRRVEAMAYRDFNPSPAAAVFRELLTQTPTDE